MKKALAMLLVLVLVLGMCVSAGAEEYKKCKLKISYSMGDNAVDGLVAAYMKKELAERSNGAITLECYGNALLAGGNMPAQVEMLIAGAGFEMAILGEQLFGAQNPHLHVTNIPFAFDSYEEAYHYADTTGGEYSAKELSGLGVKLLGTFSNSIAQLGNSKKPVYVPADLKGMKIRGLGELNMKMTQAFGCDAVSLNFAELYSALQMGTVDGQTNGYLTMSTASLQEVQPYITEINCSWVPFDIVMNQKALDKLPENTQKLIADVAAEAAMYGRQYLSDLEDQIKADFTAQGVTIITLTDEQKQAWLDAEQSVIQEYIGICGEEACRAWGIIE